MDQEIRRSIRSLKAMNHLQVIEKNIRKIVHHLFLIRLTATKLIQTKMKAFFLFKKKTTVLSFIVIIHHRLIIDIDKYICVRSNRICAYISSSLFSLSSMAFIFSLVCLLDRYQLYTTHKIKIDPS